MLQAASDGSKYGLLATWKTPERQRFLRFSRPYLTNRMMPVTRTGGGVEIRSVQDLASLEVIMEVDAAYGPTIDAARKTFTVVDMQGVENAMRAVRDGQGDIRRAQ